MLCSSGKKGAPTGTGSASSQDASSQALQWTAAKLGEDVGSFKKKLTKAEKYVDQVDKATSVLNGGAAKGNQVFGQKLENLDHVMAPIFLLNKEFPVVVPSFLKNIGTKLLQLRETVGIFRIPANTRRLIDIMDSLDAGASVLELTSLSAHDCAQLLKEWTKELEHSLIPDNILMYIFKLFTGSPHERQKYTSNEIGAVLGFLSKYIPYRSREILSCLSKCSDKNEMTARNLALVCPSLFLAHFSQKVDGSRQFEIPINMMEFLVNNPHALATLRTTNTAINGNSNPFNEFVANQGDRDRPLCDLRPLPNHVEFSAPFRISSPKSKRFQFDFQTPAQTIRLMGKATVNSVKDKFERLKTSDAKKLIGKASEEAGCVDYNVCRESSPIINRADILPVAPEIPPALSIALCTTPVHNTHQHRNRRRSSVLLSSSSQSKTFGDMDAEMSSPDMVSPARVLIFDEPSLPSGTGTHCDRCHAQLRKLDTNEIGLQVNYEKKVETKEVGLQVDFEELSLTASQQPLPPAERPCNGDFKIPVVPQLLRESGKLGTRHLSVVSIPAGIVQRRVKTISETVDGSPKLDDPA